MMNRPRQAFFVQKLPAWAPLASRSVNALRARTPTREHARRGTWPGVLQTLAPPLHKLGRSPCFPIPPPHLLGRGETPIPPPLPSPRRRHIASQQPATKEEPQRNPAAGHQQAPRFPSSPNAASPLM